MHGILNVGEMGALALHSMLEVAKRRHLGDESWISVGDLATALEASRHTLHKVTKRLVEAGLLESSRGPAGGVKLNGDPSEITLTTIVQAVEGEINAGGCLFARRVCHPEALCQFCGITRDLEHMITEYFAKTTLTDLIDRLADGSGPIGTPWRCCS